MILDKKVFVLDYTEFDELVRSNFNQPQYECVADNEWNNYASYYFPEISVAELAECDKKEMNKFVDGTGRGSPYPGHIFNHLVNEGVLDPGSYLIEVFW